jgi:hypothetical protein
MQSAAIGYLIGVHIATRRHIIKLNKNSMYGKIVAHCPHCGKIANLHYKGRECIGCDECCFTQ